MLGCDALTHTSTWLPTDVHYATDLDFNGPVVDYFEDAPESGWSIGFEPAAYDAMTRDVRRPPPHVNRGEPATGLSLPDSGSSVLTRTWPAIGSTGADSLL